MDEDLQLLKVDLNNEQRITSAYKCEWTARKTLFWKEKIAKTSKLIQVHSSFICHQELLF